MINAGKKLASTSRPLTDDVQYRLGRCIMELITEWDIDPFFHSVCVLAFESSPWSVALMKRLRSMKNGGNEIAGLMRWSIHERGVCSQGVAGAKLLKVLDLDDDNWITRATGYLNIKINDIKNY